MDTAHPTTRFADFAMRGHMHFANLASNPRALSYTFKARGALESYLRRVITTRRNVVIIPAFHCPSIVQAASRAGLYVRFVGVSRNLDIDIDHLEEQLRDDVAAVILIQYFGFEQQTRVVADLCSIVGAKLLEDWSHSFLQVNPLRLAGHHGDVALYSPWKLVPCATGGVLRYLREPFGSIETLSPPGLSISARLCKQIIEESFNNLPHRSLLRSMFMSIENFRVRHRRARKTVIAEDATCPGLTPMETYYPEREVYFSARMPAISRFLLMRSDLRSVAETHRSNYRRFSSIMRSCEGIDQPFTELDEVTCPWAFPVLMPNRRGRDECLRALEIPFFTFGEVLHPAFDSARLPAAVIATARDLSDQMICFPVHHQVDPRTYPAYRIAIEKVLADS